jgi:hypothetical protein
MFDISSFSLQHPEIALGGFRYRAWNITLQGSAGFVQKEGRLHLSRPRTVHRNPCSRLMTMAESGPMPSAQANGSLENFHDFIESVTPTAPFVVRFHSA